MPQIREYEQQIGAQGAIPGRAAQASDIGGTGMSDLGDSLVQAGRVLAQHESQLEVTDAYTTAAKIQADQTVKLTQASQSADPGDSEFSQKFTDSVKEQLDATGEKYTTGAGKQAWQRESARIAAQFVEQSGVFQAKLAGVKAQQDYQGLIDSNQITVNNDPTQFDKLLKSTQDALNDPNGTYSRIPAVDKDKISRQMKEQLAVSAMEGIIRIGPELAQKMLQNNTGPVQYVSGEQKDSLETKTSVAIHAAETLAERKQLLEKRAQNDREDIVMKDSMQKIFNPKTFGSISDSQITGLPISGERMRTLVDAKFQHARQLAENIENKSHPLVVKNIMDNWITEDNSPNKIFSFQPVNDALLKGQLSVKEWTYLSERYNNLKDGHLNTFEHDLQATISNAQDAIKNSVYFTAQPEAAFSAMTRFREDMINASENYRKQNKDPRSVLDPTNPDSPLNPNRRETYFRTSGASLKEGAKSVQKSPIAVGFESKGHRYKGGDPANMTNWEKVK